MIELKYHNGQQYASSRELHSALGIRKDFTTWAKHNIDRACLTQDKDFIFVRGKSTGGRPSIDYYLTENAAIGMAMMSGGQTSKQVREKVIEAFQQKQKGQSFDHEEITALMDLCKAMMLVSLQKEVERKHYKIFGQTHLWVARRAELLGYSKSDVENAMSKVNQKHKSIRKSLIKLDADELIRTGVIDFFKALGKTDEYARNAGKLCKEMSAKMDCGVNIWDDTEPNPLNITPEPVKKSIELKNTKVKELSGLR